MYGVCAHGSSICIASLRGMDEPHLTINPRRVAKAVGVPIGWFKAEVAAGRIPHLAAGNRRLFNIAAVRDCLARRAAEVPAASQPAGVAHVA